MTSQRNGTRLSQIVAALFFPGVVLLGCQDDRSLLALAVIDDMPSQPSIASREETSEAWKEIPEVELAALVALYEATDGDNWKSNLGWLDEETSPSAWYGVTVEGGRVTRLILHNNNLSGEIPPAMGNLSRLELLSLAHNDLTGEIPPALGNLEKLLSLQLRDNNLSGEIPSQLASLRNIRTLQLSENNLRGEIPSVLATLEHLEDLRLSLNNLSGEIPPELGNLGNLQSLWSGNNELTGQIPRTLGNLQNLQQLILQDSDLTGEIPPELGNLESLRKLNLVRNNLTGQIPPELADLDNLRSLTLYNNDLSGEIPPELGSLSNLQSLSLGVNDLTGKIPPELGNLRSLEYLNLQVSGVSGEIPPELGHLDNFRLLDLDNTGLSGRLPQTLTQLALERFRFSDTDLCEPPDDEFQEWLRGIENLRRTGVLCDEIDIEVDFTGGFIDENPSDMAFVEFHISVAVNGEPVSAPMELVFGTVRIRSTAPRTFALRIGPDGAPDHVTIELALDGQAAEKVVRLYDISPVGTCSFRSEGPGRLSGGGLGELLTLTMPHGPGWLQTLKALLDMFDLASQSTEQLGTGVLSASEYTNENLGEVIRIESTFQPDEGPMQTTVVWTEDDWIVGYLQQLEERFKLIPISGGCNGIA